MAHKIPRKQPSALYIDPAIPRSKAWQALTGTSIKVLFEFFLRRVVVKRKRRPQGGPPFDIVNNGEIVFTYLEADDRYGLSSKQFSKALDDLIEKGFLEVSHLGAAYRGDKSMYSISDRWKKYKTPEFEEVERPRDNVKRGFRTPKKKDPA